MDYIQGENRNQIKMLSWDQMIPKESMVRIIDVFVDHLPLEDMGFKKVKLKKEGRPPYHPAVLLKLYFYGYQNGLRSCRKLEKACTNNIEVIWLLNERKPHFKTIANFRRENVKSFRKVFRHFVNMLREWELVDGAAIAIDSFKVRAQNSLKNNHNARKIKRHLDYIDGKINNYLEQLEKEDAEEEILQAKIKVQEERRKKYEDLKAELKASGDGQFSTTDPDSRAVVFQRNSVKVGYNVQAVSDAKNKLLVAADTGDVNDTKALAKMVEITQENLDSAGFEMDVIADKGYHSGRELKACEKLEVTTYISPKGSSSSKRNTKFSMDKFKYDESTDSYTCPADSIMKTNGSWYYKMNERSPKG